MPGVCRSRGFAAQSLYKAYSLLAITEARQRKAMKTTTEAAEKASRWLWIKREAVATKLEVCSSRLVEQLLASFTAHFHRGRKRRVTAALRSPLLIAATLVNESISTGRAAERLSSVPGAARCTAALSFRSVLFMTRAVAEPRQFQQSRPTGQEVKYSRVIPRIQPPRSATLPLRARWKLTQGRGRSHSAAQPLCGAYVPGGNPVLGMPYQKRNRYYREHVQWRVNP
ncbi:hypothetical protein N1851_006398 [Merluccius polli]|uniref:Uncharacterized protein n=1 Tax=Merluccius polli TaxID=89951 RepID=A0AA47P5Z1_MERPO|nr:hypothetical protein N1851_006398 [Merluccius polli]